MRLNLLAVFVMLAAAGSLEAGPILQPAGASSDIGALAFTAPNRVRNQSGLSVGYTSGVTDFDAYIAGGPTHDSDTIFNNWLSSLSGPTGNFDFDLGGSFLIESFALWNRGNSLDPVFNSQNVVGFTLLADDNSTFTSPVSLGSFTADPSLANIGTADAVRPEVFPFAPTQARFVRMQITSNNGDPDISGFGEAAFEVSTIPEPTSFVLLGLGALGLWCYGWRRKRPKQFKPRQ